MKQRIAKERADGSRSGAPAEADRDAEPQESDVAADASGAADGESGVADGESGARDAEDSSHADESSPADAKPGASAKRRKRDPKDLAPYVAVVEGLLFTSREPVGVGRLASVIGDLTTAEVKEVLDKLDQDYRRRKRGVMIEEVAGGFRLVTVPDLSVLVKKLHRIRTEERLTPAALECLAIVAYRQPVIRADIEAIRGVSCGGTLKWLLDKGLVRIIGRAEVLGRPLLYGTTREFLEQFGINAIEDLPRVDEFRSKTEG